MPVVQLLDVGFKSYLHGDIVGCGICVVRWCVSESESGCGCGRSACSIMGDEFDSHMESRGGDVTYSESSCGAYFPGLQPLDYIR